MNTTRPILIPNVCVHMLEEQHKALKQIDRTILPDKQAIALDGICNMFDYWLDNRGKLLDNLDVPEYIKPQAD